MKHISVVIPTYNRSHALATTIASLEHQNVQVTYEVIVCDDGSSDDTPELVARLAATGDLDLIYLRHERNGARYAATRNMGIRAARGSLIVFLDDDMIASPTFLSAHLESQRTPKTVTLGYRYNVLPDGLGGWQLSDDVREPHFSSYPDIGVPAWTIMETCNVSVEREFLYEAGLFDEGFRGWSAEDIELGYRLHKNGAKFVLSKLAYGRHQYDPNPPNSFLRYARGLTPDFGSQTTNLSRFKSKYPADSDLQVLLSQWIERLRNTEARMLLTNLQGIHADGVE